MLATREKALVPSARRFVEVYVPEQDLTYRIRSITERERQYYRQVLCSEDEPLRNQVALVLFTCVDEAGDRIFQDDDGERLAALDSAVTSRLYQAALEHCSYEEGDLGNSARIPIASSR
jgi:hypothetical protein